MDEDPAISRTEVVQFDPKTLDSLMPEVYEDLCRVASRRLRDERGGHTLQTAGLVNEAYLRMSRQARSEWQSRGQFFAVAARMMRRVLVDHARAHGTAKRGGDVEKVSLEHITDWSGDSEPDIEQLDTALEALAAVDIEQARIVEFKFFGGLTHEEIAEVLGVSPATVKRRWLVARAWLYRALRGERKGGP
jgi:RNA polymerase sigma factor (TIGR02999 family)